MVYNAINEVKDVFRLRSIYDQFKDTEEGEERDGMEEKIEDYCSLTDSILHKIKMRHLGRDKRDEKD